MAKGSKGKKRPPGRRPAPARARAAPVAGRADGGVEPPPKASQPSPPAKPVTAAKQTRAERLEAARRARRRKALQVRIGAVAVLVVVAVVVGLLVRSDKEADEAERDRLTAGSCTYDTKGEDVSPVPGNHVAPASYKVDPPSKGNHAPLPVGAGVYGVEGAPAPPDSQLVHSLEHGFVILWHRPDLAENDLAEVRGVYEKHSEDVLMVPRPSLKQKVAATSWGRRLLCGEVEPTRLEEFVEKYRNDAPEPRS